MYLPTLGAGFVWDDHFIVTANRQIRSLADLPALLTSHAFAGAGEVLGRERLVEYYRPVWTLSLAVDHALWGLRPFGYHLTNLLLHATTSVAVFGLARARLGGLTAPLVAALFFAVNPAHVEAVAWVSSRNEVLAGLFVAIALAAYAAWRGGGGPRAAFVCGAASALALLSKETAVALPLMAAAFEALPGPGGGVTTVKNAMFGFAPEFLIGKGKGGSDLFGLDFEAVYGETADFTFSSEMAEGEPKGRA